MKKKIHRVGAGTGSAGAKKSANGSEMEEIRSLITKMAPILRHAKYDGTYAGERDLLECPGCGLVEDTAMDGGLLTYIDGGRMKDSGYRFWLSSNGAWICPVCHTVGGKDGVC